MRNKIDWETINAYIDGALTPNQAAEVAKAVAVDSVLAKQVAALSALKATVASALQDESPDIELPEKQALAWLPWVASFAWVLVATVVLMALTVRTDWMLPGPSLNVAEQIHQTWLQSGAAASRESEAGMLKTNLKLLELDAYVPDLSKVNLTFSGIRRVSTRGGGLHIGYVGPSGCMVSLVVLKKQESLPETLQRFERPDHVVYGWRVRQASFYLLADRMDRKRLAEIARVVYRLTRIRLPLDPQSVLALKHARQSAEPCVT